MNEHDDNLDVFTTSSLSASEQPLYMCIDLKTFYASVECADRGLNPFTTNLVVADPTRSDNTICLAITPAMKQLGVANRCRINDIPPGISYEVAPPRMKHYMDISARIVEIYLSFVAPVDLYPYSIDECFIYISPYLKLYQVSAMDFAQRLQQAVLMQTHITATVGIGTNLFLAKVALDIRAKHCKNGIGMLNSQLFKKYIWFYTPLTDIWGIGKGTQRHLEKLGIDTLAGVCSMPKNLILKEFGKNGRYLLEHAWGLECMTIPRIKAYTPKAHSITNGQVFMRDYTYQEVFTILHEMTTESSLDLVRQRIYASGVSLNIGFSMHFARIMESNTSGEFKRRIHSFSSKLCVPTNNEQQLYAAFKRLYEAHIPANATIRRVQLNFTGLCLSDACASALPCCSDIPSELQKLPQTIVDIRKRFGANYLLKATSLRPEANARIRNKQIGGHRA